MIQPADFVDAYTQWAIASIDACATSAAAMVDKSAQGSYTAADLFAEAGLWFGRMAQATTDLYGSIANGPAAGGSISSDDFTAPAPAQYLGARDLRLAGPLQATMTSTTIGTAQVTIVPPTLSGGATTFHLELDPGNLPGDAYWGTVDVVSNGTVIDTVDVVIQVP